MRHQAQDVALRIAYAGDRSQRAVRICGRIHISLDITVAKRNLAIALKARQYFRITEIIAFRMSNRNMQHLTRLRRRREGSCGALHPDVNVPADKPKASVAHQRTGQQARLAQDLKPVTNTCLLYTSDAA